MLCSCEDYIVKKVYSSHNIMGYEKCDMRIVKEQLLQQYVIEAISQIGVSDSIDYSDELVLKYIKRIQVFDDNVLVETIELT